MSGGGDRASLLAELGRAIREMTAQSILLSQAVGDLVGLNPTNLECLDFVHMRGGATPGDLAAATGLTTGAMTSVIDRLERAGYVRREPDPADRRKVVVRVEPEAVMRVEALYAPIEEALFALWSRYGDDELAVIADFLRRSTVLASAETAALRARGAPDKPRRRSGRAVPTS